MRKRDENTYTNKPRTCRKSVRIESESKAVYSFSSGISSVNAKITRIYIQDVQHNILLQNFSITSILARWRQNWTKIWFSSYIAADDDRKKIA